MAPDACPGPVLRPHLQGGGQCQPRGLPPTGRDCPQVGRGSLCQVYHPLLVRFPKSKFCDKSQAEKLEAIARYVNLVMRPELSLYIDPVSISRLDWSQFQLVREAVAGSRPPARLVKDIFYPAALLMPDYALRPPQGARAGARLLAVEIKPKLGVMAERGSAPGHGLCNFCLKQHFKLSTGAVSSLSQYCPMDLFSGDPARMLAALRALTASPQNNLRLLADGELLAPAETAEVVESVLGGEQLLAPLLVSCLTQTPGQPAPALLPPLLTAGPGKTAKVRCNAAAGGGQALPQHCVLATVLRLQARSRLTDLEAEVLLQSLLEEGRELAELQEVAAGTCPAEERLLRLRDYLLAVTARDLSLILTLAEADLPSSNCVRVRDKWIAFQWSVVDVDPKNLNMISKYVEQKKLWLAALHQTNHL